MRSFNFPDVCLSKWLSSSRLRSSRAHRLPGEANHVKLIISIWYTRRNDARQCAIWIAFSGRIFADLRCCFRVLFGYFQRSRSGKLGSSIFSSISDSIFGSISGSILSSISRSPFHSDYDSPLSLVLKLLCCLMLLPWRACQFSGFNSHHRHDFRRFFLENSSDFLLEDEGLNNSSHWTFDVQRISHTESFSSREHLS